MIFAKNFARFYEKKYTLNIRRLVDNSFVPSAWRAGELYCKLTDFMNSRSSLRPCIRSPVGEIRAKSHFPLRLQVRLLDRGETKGSAA